MATGEARGNLLAEIGLARIGVIAASVVLALALQSTLLVKLTLLGVIPQLELVVIVAIAFTDGPRVGAVAGFFGGLLVDLMIPQSTVGISALVFTLVGYAVGTFRQYTTADSIWTPVLVVALSSCVAEGGYAILSVILGQPWVSIDYTLKIIALVVLYNCLLTPLVYPVVRKALLRVRPERVYRW